MAKVTDITAQKKRPGRVSVYLDGEFWIGMKGEMIVDTGLLVGLDVDEQLKERIERQVAVSEAVAAAWNLLSYRSRSRKELCDHLAKKGYDDAVIAETMILGVDYGWVDDDAFAEELIAAAKAGGRSRSATARKLSRAGVDRDIVEAALDEHYPVAGELSVALVNHRGGSERELRKKLRSRGFSHAVIDEVSRKAAAAGFADETDFAVRQVQAARSKGRACRVVASELRAAHVPEAVCDRVLAEHYPPEAEYDVALEWARGRYDGSERSREKLQRQLAARGFAWGTLRDVIDDLDAERAGA